MNCEKHNRFDYYLCQAIAQGCGGVADYYDSLDTTKVEISRRLDRAVYRLIRRQEKGKTHPRTWSTSRRIVACLAITLAILMLFTLSIAALEGGLWNAVVNWYEDYFALHLGETSSPPATLPPAQIPLEWEPRFVKQAKKPAKLPVGWTDEVTDICQYWVYVDLFEDGDDAGYYCQKVMSLKDTKEPTNVKKHEQVKVGEYTADFYACTNGYRILRWADLQYYYEIMVYYNALTADEMVAMAESLENIHTPSPSIAQIRRPTGMLRNVREISLDQNARYVVIEYRDAETDYQLAIFEQRTLYEGRHTPDPDEYDVYEILIGDHVGVAYSYRGVMIDYLYWSDGDYWYTLTNVDLSDSEMIEWAESVSAPSIPEQLETVYMPQNLPKDLEELVWIKNSAQIVVDYSRGEEIVFTYTQELLNRYSKVTDPEHTAQVVDIHHDYGYAKLFPDGSITLTWNNGQYRFILESRGMTLDELVKVARDIAPPERIVEVRGPSGLSPTITQTVLTQNESMVMLEYSRDDMLIGRFMQTLRWNEEAEYDPGCEMTNVSISAYTGVLLTYPDGRRTVIWNDASYRYQLESTSMPTEVIIAWAASVRAIDIEEQSPIATAPPSTIKEERKPKKLTGGIREMSTVKEKDSVTVRYQKNRKEVAVFVQRVIEDDAYLDGITYRSLWFFEYGIVYLSGERDEQLLLWTDGEYYYEIQSDILSPDDLLIFAKSMME